MNLFIQVLLIVIIFFKTGNLLSDNNIFNVNNIILEKKDNNSIKDLTDLAIKKGFNELIRKLLLKEDFKKVSDLKFAEIKQLVTYYKIGKNSDEDNDSVNFNLTFDKDNIHDLFYKKGISYSDIRDKEFYVLPIFSKNNEFFIFSNNYFYTNWNKIEDDELIEFILPLENIELIQSINKNKNNLLDLELVKLLKEYSNKNLAIILIEENSSSLNKIYIKARIQGKSISKSMKFEKKDLNQFTFYQKMIFNIKDELTNMIKSQNLIDIRTPSFLNVKLILNKKNNLVILNSKINNVNLIENIYVQDVNKDYVNLRIKYLGKLEKIIDQLNTKKIKLELINEEWLIKIL